MNQPVSNQHFQTRNSLLSSAKGRLVGVLDIGTSKVTCFIAQITSSQSGGMADLRQIKGVGHRQSFGFKAGIVMDMAAAEKSIRAAVDAAERMAEVKLEHVYVGISAAGLQSHTYNSEIPLNGLPVDDVILRGVLHSTYEKCLADDVEPLHVVPISYRIDGKTSVKDPRGMFGDSLMVTTHAITTQSGPVRNLLACISKCHLKIQSLVATPYASALACLVQDEMDLGVLAVDMGSATTSFTIFHDGSPIHTGVIACGSNQITRDISIGLGISLEHAERIKIIQGSALADSSASSAHEETFQVKPLGGDGVSELQTVDRSMLSRIIRSRFEEIMEILNMRLNATQLSQFAGRQLVLTGGGAQLNGAKEVAAHVLEKQVRIGAPIRFTGLPAAASGPAFSAAAGLVAYASRENDFDLAPQRSNKLLTALDKGLVGHFGRWLKRNF